MASTYTTSLNLELQATGETVGLGELKQIQILTY